MISKVLSEIGAAIAPAMANHLWQSTVCLIIVGLLTLVFRKNHARARYGLWLAASVKFLIPLALLIGIGTHLARPRVVAPTETGFFFAMEEVSQPFTKAPGTVKRSLPNKLAADWRHRLLPAIPAVFVAVWLGGFLLVLAGWWRRWRRVAKALHAAHPLREGREVEALRRVEHLAGVQKPIDLLLSPTSLEPGIFGIVDPVLVWPAGISEHLQDAHLEAILAHEVEHVRRHDNLAATIHMVVEALFWFHPLVWWLGARMVEERELACDEAVLQLGGEPQVYAESILKTCQFCLESPLACVSGITGADLKKRIVRILTQLPSSKLSFGKKLLLVAVGVTVIAGPVVFGFVNAPEIQALATQTTAGPLLSFEVASIKPTRSPSPHHIWGILPERFTTKNVTTKMLIAYAYNVRDFQVSGGPSWIDSAQYDIVAKNEDAVTEKLRKLPWEQYREMNGLMVQSLLADRFKLRVSQETKDLPVYLLVFAKNGPKLTLTKGPPGSGPKRGPWIKVGAGQLTTMGMSLPELADKLSEFPDVGGRRVLDQTGLKNKYDIALKWTPDRALPGTVQGSDGGKPASDNAAPPESSGPSIFTALQEQLGLKLESTKGPVEIIVIDHIEKPSEN